jgi:hypothetical protein
MHSADLLELQADGSLPDVIIVEIVDDVTGVPWFRFNLSPAEAAKYPIVNNTLPLNIEWCNILDELKQMCGHCFVDERTTLKARQRKCPTPP